LCRNGIAVPSSTESSPFFSLSLAISSMSIMFASAARDMHRDRLLVHEVKHLGAASRDWRV
jgi:hypothetical protein